MNRRLLLSVGAALTSGALLGIGFSIGSYTETLTASKLRVSQNSTVIKTKLGKLEYAIAGSGKPLLMIHGTGGGFDQGLRFAHRLIEKGKQVIAPSRFGYLQSDFPIDPSPENQADNLVELLDRLGIEKLPVVGGSAGALPAVHLALRHPGRCSQLILLVPAANLTNRDPVEFTAFEQFLVGRLLTSDFWFWATTKLAPSQMIKTLLATNPLLLEEVGPEERQRAEIILRELQPISQRTKGMHNDALYAGSAATIDLASIRPPMLIVSTEDDLFGTAETARTIAARVPAARLVIYPSGGHIWLGHDEDVANEIMQFIQ
jgi:pimeloyl-ACP methyl ester carboxylesterase